MLISCAWQTSLDRQAALVGYSNLRRRKAFDLRTRTRRADKTWKRQIHPSAQIEGATIGTGTRVWQFCIILPQAQVGDNCNICAHVFIENDVVIGDRVTIKSGVQLWDGTRIEDDVFIGPNATFTNDRTPRSRKRRSLLVTRVQRCATIGANATILPGLTIGQAAMVSAGAVVTRDVPEHGLMVGNPARRKGWVCLCGETLRGSGLSCQCGKRYKRGVGGLAPVS
jgi:UDP-2-acetamido-3-amino-2,3-dideoxy-glucuronate N-acetyltransferase